MSASLPLIPDDTYIINITTDMADVMVPLRSNSHRALSARAEHRVGVRVLA